MDQNTSAAELSALRRKHARERLERDLDETLRVRGQKPRHEASGPSCVPQRPDEILTKAQAFVRERETRIADLTAWIGMLEMSGYERAAERSRELLAVLQRNLETSRDNLRVLRNARSMRVPVGGLLPRMELKHE